MAELGTVLAATAGMNRDDTGLVRLIKAEMSSTEDIQTLQLIGGLDYCPLPGTKVLVLDIGESWKLAIPLSDGQTPTAQPGEKYLYSQLPSGTIAAMIKLKLDGTIEVGGNTDTMIAFSRMKTAFNLLKTQINSELAEIATAIGELSGAYVVTPVAADMSAAESPTVKLP